MTEKHDVIIIGAGLAALTAAARLCELGVRDLGVYAASWGGTPFIAAINFVWPGNPYGDTGDLYYEDMMRAGYGISDKKLVRNMARKSLQGYELLRRWGVEFAKNLDGSMKLRHLSGHSCPRSLCCTTELIGDVMLKKLIEGLKKYGVEPRMGVECLDLLSDGKQIAGAWFRGAGGERFCVHAPVVVAGWGGVGNLFGRSTYPPDIKGNTLAMAKDAGAKLVDVEFLEYEPMVVMSPPGAAGEPCPTAMLGEGAHLLNADGEMFLLKERPQGEAGAPKSLINRLIWRQAAAGKGNSNGGVWVDLRHIDKTVLQAYPWFYNRLVNSGLDPNESLVEVGPMAHSFSGGIAVDEGYQSSVSGLYAVGEACGGVHGACRSAGNAAAQAVLSGLQCAESIAAASVPPAVEVPAADYAADPEVYERYVPRAKALAADALGIYRDGTTLQKALDELESMMGQPCLAKDAEARQILESIALMVRAALKRKESRGTHLRLDYPETSKEYEKEFFI